MQRQPRNCHGMGRTHSGPRCRIVKSRQNLYQIFGRIHLVGSTQSKLQRLKISSTSAQTETGAAIEAVPVSVCIIPIAVTANF